MYNTHVRFTDTGKGSDFYGVCECCKQEANNLTIIVYGESYGFMADNGDWHDGISHKSTSYECPKCTQEKLVEAERLGLDWFKRNKKEDSPCCLYPSRDKCRDCQELNPTY